MRQLPIAEVASKFDFFTKLHRSFNQAKKTNYLFKIKLCLKKGSKEFVTIRHPNCNSLIRGWNFF